MEPQEMEIKLVFHSLGKYTTKNYYCRPPTLTIPWHIQCIWGSCSWLYCRLLPADHYFIVSPCHNSGSPLTANYYTNALVK